MLTLAFLSSIAVVFGVVLAIETGGATAEAFRRPAGLIAWLTHGNWPAKIGAGLVIVGVGALLRYAAINFDLEPRAKLTIGMIAAAILGAGATFARGQGRRPVSLALAGAAFGVAYLSAYSAFALFQYLESETGLALLALTSIAAGVYAVSRNAISVALLAMLGAFLGPAFAIGDPGPVVVYGYYIGASVLTLLMVMARGWRPLIHLSFLFTLGGGVFFAWTSKYYTHEFVDVMFPSLLALVTLHVAMPLLEKQYVRGVWLERLDVSYLLLLPAVAAILATIIAPTRAVLAGELGWLAAVWLVAAISLAIMRRDGAITHGVIGAALVILALAARFAELPWQLLSLGLAVIFFGAASRKSELRGLHGFLAGLVLLLSAVHVLSSLGASNASAPFANREFLMRLIGAALMIYAGRICLRVQSTLDSLLIAVGVGWAAIALGIEIVHWNLVSLALILNWLMIVTALLVGLLAGRRPSLEPFVALLALGLLITASAAARSTPLSASWATLVAAGFALIAVALRARSDDDESSVGRAVSAVVTPIVAMTWASHIAQSDGMNVFHFPLTVAVIVAICVLGAGQLWVERSADWRQNVADIFAAVFASILAIATLFAIHRGAWAIALEIACLVGIVFIAVVLRAGQERRLLGPACFVGIALLVQANALRMFGPEGTLSIFDIGKMRWPAALSLLWVVIGAVLTVWARRIQSRSLWIGGATLLVAAAVKVVLVDFGALGELENILAVIAAGIMFLLVGWLAPMPPAHRGNSEPSAGDAAASSPAPAAATSAMPRVTNVGPLSQPQIKRQSAAGSKTELVMPQSYSQRSTAPKNASNALYQSSGHRGWVIFAVVVLIAALLRSHEFVGRLLRLAFP